MAIVITVGSNSWITLTEANDYLEAKFGATAWSSLSSDLKKQLIISAFRWIYFSGKFAIAKTANSENVKNAQIEAAWWMYNNYEDYVKRNAIQAGGVTSFSLSRWSESFSGKQSFPFEVQNLLENYVTGGEYFPLIDRDND